MVEIRLMGGLRLLDEGGDAVRGRAAQKRRLALLVLLACPPGRRLTRDKLVAYLWPESSGDCARHLLAGAVYDLRRALGEGVLRSAGDDLWLDPRSVRTDVSAFLDTFEVGDAERAVSLWGGPFLDGVHLADSHPFEEWVSEERTRLGRIWAEALEWAARDRMEAGDAAGAVEAWRQLAGTEPYAGWVALGLMRALVSAGRRMAAIEHARQHAARLREEFGAEPDEAVKALAEQLRSRPSAREAAASSPEPARHLRSLRAPQRTADPRKGPVRRSRPRLADRTAVAVGVLLLTAGSFWAGGRWWSELPGAGHAPGSTVGSLAVLPFANLSGDPAQDILAEWFTDAVVTELARIRTLRVLSRTSVVGYRGGHPALEDAGRRSVGSFRLDGEVAADLVVEGSVVRGPDWIRVTARLIEVRSEAHLWARSYQAAGDDVLGVQTALTRDLVGWLDGDGTAGRCDVR